MNKCIQCGNIYLSEPETKTGLCFRCEIKQKDQQIAELKQQVKAKDILIDTYMSVVGTLTNAKNIKQQLAEKDKEIKYFESEWKGCQIDLDHYKGECFNLKDQLHTQPKEIVEMIKTLGEPMPHKSFEPPYMWLIGKSDLDEILKEYDEK